MPNPESDTLPRAQALAGRTFQVRDHYEVGREKVREFARAVQNRHPAHRHEAHARQLGYTSVLAPPTFSSIIVMTGIQALLNTVLTDYDLSQVLHTDQIFEIHRPVVAGDRLRSMVTIESIRSVRDADFVVVGFTITDDAGAVVQVASTTIVARRGEKVLSDIAQLVEGVVMHSNATDDLAPVLIPITAAAANPVADVSESRRGTSVDTVPRFGRLAVGDVLPLRTIRLARGDLVNYAGVSGDPNPIHFSDAAAQFAGLPTVVAHGMLTMGLTAGYLTSWLDDPTAIQKFSVRFSRLAQVEERVPIELELDGRIQALGPESNVATVVLGVRAAGEKLFGRAFAEVLLSP